MKSIISSKIGGGQTKVTSFGFPSDKYIDFTPQVSGSVYDIPDNGYLHVQATATSSSSSWIDVAFPLYCVGLDFARTGASFRCCIPVTKDTQCMIRYGVANLTLVRFIYAKGNEE